MTFVDLLVPALALLGGKLVQLRVHESYHPVLSLCTLTSSPSLSSIATQLQLHIAVDQAQLSHTSTLYFHSLNLMHLLQPNFSHLQASSKSSSQD